MAVDFVQSSGLVLVSSVEAFEAVSEWLCDQCLDSLVRHGEDSTLTYLLTAGCATHFGITGQRLGGGKASVVAPFASWSTSVTFKATRDTMQGAAKKRAFDKSDDTRLTMLRLYRGPSVCAAGLELESLSCPRPLLHPWSATTAAQATWDRSRV